jgi:hypothetical protein
VSEAQNSGVELAKCLRSWRAGENDTDSRAASVVVAEVILLIRSALRKR